VFVRPGPESDMSLRRTVIVALVLAVLGGLTFVASFQGFGWLAYLAILLSVGWVAAVSYAFKKYGKRGWPTLLGAPGALFWLYFLIAVSYSCGTGRGCL
jgi:hypothetical protein